jgi:hypothetical protein
MAKRKTRADHFWPVVFFLGLFVLREHVEGGAQKVCRLRDIKEGRERHGEDREAMGSMRRARQGKHQRIPYPQEQGDKSAPLLHRRVIKHTIELHARHYDRMKPVTSPAAVSTTANKQNSAGKERGGGGRPLYAPIMYVPHICQRDDAFLHHIPQILDRRTRAAPYTWAASRRWQERARCVGVQTLRIPLARGGDGGSGCGGCGNWTW